eukprot:gnl/MRDRNA2_/MRDRNA2_157773_c0_seq1.p1 gnl/MRDRNA2_/MRDRNA2_157773_c0~~gnl/MRDRNA2_/MRDRNA2_157773_c0_seq1.p1  ORF type:complete len:155 (+),score=21.88 gnl/MRDRNA2_/MRDRNA2_157773_c0_seq1:97-561(+)
MVMGLMASSTIVLYLLMICPVIAENVVQKLQVKAQQNVNSTSIAHYESKRKVAAQVVALGVICDNMCKAVHAYPTCACPAPFPADINADAAAAGVPPCLYEHCTTKLDVICPNQPFITCVMSSFKPSLALLQTLPELPELKKRLAAVQACRPRF